MEKEKWHDSADMGKGKNPVIISPLVITVFLLVMTGFLLLANLGAIYFSAVLESKSMFSLYLTKYFGFNEENNFPTLFSSILLLLASGFLALIYLSERVEQKKQWLILSMIFLFLGIDENIQIHEKITGLVRPLLLGDANGFFHWAWVIPYFIFFVVVSLYFLPFVKSLNPKLRKLFFISGSLFVSGAIGLELFEGYFFKLYGVNHLYNQILYCAEELLEMTGVIIFLYALMDYMSAYEATVLIFRKDEFINNKEYELKGNINTEGNFQSNSSEK